MDLENLEQCPICGTKLERNWERRSWICCHEPFIELLVEMQAKIDKLTAFVDGLERASRIMLYGNPNDE